MIYQIEVVRTTTHLIDAPNSADAIAIAEASPEGLCQVISSSVVWKKEGQCKRN